MISYSPSKRTVSGTDYKFNNDGEQVAYHYDVEVTKEDAYDRAEAKRIMRECKSLADKTSSMIDGALVNTAVSFRPSFNVNDSFEDNMELWLRGSE